MDPALLTPAAKKPRFPFFTRLLAAAGLVACVACDATKPLTPVPPATLALEPDSVELTVQQGMNLVVSLTGARWSDVAYTSSAPAVASVDANGHVDALQPGRAVVRGTVTTFPLASDSVVVHVKACTTCLPDDRFSTVAFNAVTDTAGARQDLKSLHGTVVIDALVDIPPGDTLQLQFRVDTVTVCTRERLAGQILSIPCRLNADSVIAGARRFAPGPHVLQLLLRRGTLVLAQSSLPGWFAVLAPAAVTAPLVSISTSGAHTCAVARDGSAYCWGDGDRGQLGHGGFASSLLPVRVQGPALVSIGAGANLTYPEYDKGDPPPWSATCGRTAVGTALCWGYFWAIGDDRAQCVECAISDAALPTEPYGGRFFATVNVDPNGSEVCGISLDREVFCWGIRASAALITPGLRKAHAYARTPWTTCGIDPAGVTICHGSNRFGEAAAPWTGDSVASHAVAFPQGVALDTVVASMAHICGLTGAGEAWCWGRNDEGQLGAGATENLCLDALHNTHACPDAPAAPRKVTAPRKFVRISAGALHTCALGDDGSAWCWGRNAEGQLGSAGASTPTPRAVQTSLRFTEISAGGRSTCAIAAGGEAWCWGDNRWGQLGTGDRTAASTPVRVRGQ